MIHSALPSHAMNWDLMGPSTLIHQKPMHLGFGALGKSFLIDNILRDGDTHATKCLPVACSTFQVSPSPTAEQISPPGGTYPTTWAFRLIHPSDTLPGLYQQPLTGNGNKTGFSKCFFLQSLPFYPACCGGSCPHPASPTAFPRSEPARDMPVLTQDSNTKVRRVILRRAVFSEDQRKALEKMFQKQKYISKADRKKLAVNLALKESQVKIWFQNRRMKWRNSKEKEVLSKMCLKEEMAEQKLSRTASSLNVYPAERDLSNIQQLKKIKTKLPCNAKSSLSEQPFGSTRQSPVNLGSHHRGSKLELQNNFHTKI
ncbi:homeobox protein DBX2 [Pelobates fuscus]|uniref:homeobox protein DBX2 n=1 Tax=Pelobates fuscus TaxID=191477 RepID=UPI002FE48F27